VHGDADDCRTNDASHASFRDYDYGRPQRRAFVRELRKDRLADSRSYGDTSGGQVEVTTLAGNNCKAGMPHQFVYLVEGVLAGVAGVR
jgi:hypothetical protein